MRNFSLIFCFVLVHQSHSQISDFEFINFSKADSVALKYKDEPLNNLPALSQKLTAGLATDVEKFRSLFKWICINFSNDYGLYYRNKHKRNKFKDDSLKLASWNDRFKKIIFKKMINNRRTICTGYAYLLKELSEFASIECEIIHGYGKTSMTTIEEDTAPNHSWNVVKLNDKWYLADPTWASGIPETSSNRFQFYFNEGYFLSHPELFVINHYPLETEWTLLDKPPTFEDFLNAPILYGNAYESLVNIDAPRQMHHTLNRKEIFSFDYVLSKAILKEQVQLMIDSGNNTRTFTPHEISTIDNELKINYRFNYSGFYDVHLLIDDRLVSTHTVKVKR